MAIKPWTHAWRKPALLVYLLASLPARAQIVSDGATNTLDNVTNLITGEVTVGTNGSFTLLILTNNTLLSNSGNAFIGRNTGANSNRVWLSGANTRWITRDLFVGSNGSFNSLVVSNGAQVLTRSGHIGFSASSVSNTVVVTGAGSLWTNNVMVMPLSVGLSGGGNRLVVSAGGRVDDGDGFIGNLSGNNEALVTGSNSFWNHAFQMFVGFGGTNNRLVISNGGLVGDITGSIGQGSSGSNNIAIVTGPGSFWSNRGVLYVGRNASGNRLVVENGGRVDNNGGYIGNSASGDNAAWVTGGGSLWSNRVDLVVGVSSSGNQLIVSNGGTVFVATNGVIGMNSGANSNTATVTGTGSLWSSGSDLFVGNLGSGNHLIVSNGGTVFASNLVAVGFSSGSSNNRVVMDGGTLRVANATGNGFLDMRRGTNVLNAGLIDVDQLMLTNAEGRFVFNGGTLITRGAFITNLSVNSVFSVGASGSNPAVWDVRSGVSNTFLSGQLAIGSNVSFSQLLITNGALLTNASIAYLGLNSGSKSNTAIISGPGSRWAIGDQFYVGYAGAFNRLVVSNGAVVSHSTGYIGHDSTASNNEVTVTDMGSSWGRPVDINADVIVGFSGTGNRLVVSNGGRVMNRIGSIGTHNGSNLVMVTGAGSFWTNSLSVNVGVNGSGNRAVVSNGGVVAALQTIVGSSIGTNNEIVVTGGGSLWSNSADFQVGNSGAFNRLVISDGGRVGNGLGYVGFNSSSSNNEALVTGTGSFWSNQSGLVVGNLGSGNRLVISDGGRVGNHGGFIGFGSSGSNNEALVTGAGSFWSNRADVFVGIDGSGNRLVITNGGTVFASNGIFLGFSLSSSNNLLTVGGGSLIATNPAGSGVLNLRSGTNVFNSGTMDVDRLLLTNSQGFFTFNGGTLKTKGMTNTNGRTFTVGNGTSAATLQLLGGAHVFANNLLIASNATLLGGGNIIGSVTNFGVLSVGNSAGSLRIDGNLRLRPSASLTFELGGLIPTNQYDQITVASFVEFAGTLSLALLPNFLPDADDSFTLLTFASSSGAFSNAPLGGRVSFSNHLASFAATYSLTNFVLGDVQYADSDGDGQGDLQEAAAGTNPNDQASALAITSITQDLLGRYVIQFQSVSGKTYRVEYSNDLVTWSTAVSAIFTEPSAGLSQWVDDGSLTGGLPPVRRAYRIGLQ